MNSIIHQEIINDKLHLIFHLRHENKMYPVMITEQFDEIFLSESFSIGDGLESEDEEMEWQDGYYAFFQDFIWPSNYMFYFEDE